MTQPPTNDHSTPPPPQGQPHVGQPQSGQPAPAAHRQQHFGEQQAQPPHPSPLTPGLAQQPGVQGHGQPPAQTPEQAFGSPDLPGLEHIDHDLRAGFDAVRTEVERVVVGQSEAVGGLLLALLCEGHVLLEGVPGVAKTLLVRTLAQTLQLDTSRVQFTPDLMPADVTGSLIFDTRANDFEFREGPVFTNLLIADEINRTPPKTQSSLLEAMEERHVSVDGQSLPLPDPFLVAATQNPVEYEGTYPLPEAQLDRFLFKLVMTLPARDTELEILSRHAAGFDARNLEATGLARVLDAEAILLARKRVSRVHCAPQVLGYIVDLVQATRAAPSLVLGVSPRGATRMLAAARAQAWLDGRAFITPDDVKTLTPALFRHRVLLRPEAQMDGIDIDQVISSIVASTPVPR